MATISKILPAKVFTLEVKNSADGFWNRCQINKDLVSAGVWIGTHNEWQGNFKGSRNYAGSDNIMPFSNTRWKKVENRCELNVDWQTIL